MKLFKSPLRRTGAMVAGSVLGLASVAMFAAPASAHHSELNGVAECVSATGEWKITWTLRGIGDQDKPYRLAELSAGPQGSTLTGDLKKSAEGEFPYTSYQQYTGVQTVSGDTAEATMTAQAVWKANDFRGDSKAYTKTVELKDGCKKDEPSTPPSTPPTTTPPASESPSPSPSTSTPANPIPELPGEPEPIVEITCDTITLGAENPADGIEFDMKFETSKGEVRETTVAPGEKKTETFSATDGFTVDWTISAVIDGKTESFTETIPYTQPDECEDGEGGGLPVTGAAAGGIAGGAGALLVVGAGLFFMARRRKVKFTA